MLYSSLKQQKFASIFLLCAMLFVAVAHSHEYLEDTVQVEQLDCKLCQQVVDQPNADVAPTTVTQGCFSATKICIPTQVLSNDEYPHCAPRAPPVTT